MRGQKLLLALTLLSVSLLLGESFTPAAQDKKADQEKKEGQEKKTDQPKKNTAAFPKEGNLAKRHEGFMKDIAKMKGDIDIMLMGDSITDGWRNTGKAAFAKYFEPLKTVNLGIGGDTTQGVLWRLDNGELEGYKAKLIMLMIGTNNTNSHSAEQIAEGIKAVVERFRAKQPQSKVLLLGVFPRSGGKGGKGGLNPAPGNINKIISTYDDAKMIKYMDIGSKFLDKDGAIPKNIMNDGLHPTGEGYQVWADAVMPTVYEMIGKKK